MNPRISIVMNTLNRKEGLRKALLSVRAQTFSYPFEVHIVDGGSNDGSTDLFDEFSDIITTAVSEKDRNLYHAMNKGIKKSKGDYVFVLPSGDYFHNSQVLASFFNTEQHADILYGDLMVEKSGFISRVTVNLEKFMKAKDCFHHQACFVKRSVFEKHGFMPEVFCLGDQMFFLRLFYDKGVSLKYIHHPVCVYDFNDGFSVTNGAKGALEMQQFVASRKLCPVGIQRLVQSLRNNS